MTELGESTGLRGKGLPHVAYLFFAIVGPIAAIIVFINVFEKIARWWERREKRKEDREVELHNREIRKDYEEKQKRYEERRDKIDRIGRD